MKRELLLIALIVAIVVVVYLGCIGGFQQFMTGVI